MKRLPGLVVVIGLGIGLGLVAVLASTARAELIDNFNEGGLGATVGLGEGQTNDSTGHTGVIGGTRKASVKFTGSGATANVHFTVDGHAGNSGVDNFYQFQGRSGPTAIGQAKMVLDGNNSTTGLTVDGTGGINFNGLGPLDLTEGGAHHAFEFVTGTISGSHSVTLTVYDSSDNDGTNTSYTFALAGSGTRYVSFSHFDEEILADAGALALQVNLDSDGAILQLDNWQTSLVPEPSTLVGLLSMAAVGLLIAWRRRRQ